MPGSQAGASQEGAKDVAKRKATKVGSTLEGERPTSRSRKSQGGESRKAASRATPSDSEKSKKETSRAKQSSGHKGKGSTSKGASHSNQDPEPDLEVEIVGSAEPDPVAEVERLKAKGYQGVKPGDRLAKYLDPVKDLDWSAEKV